MSLPDLFCVVASHSWGGIKDSKGSAFMRPINLAEAVRKIVREVLIEWISKPDSNEEDQKPTIILPFSATLEEFNDETPDGR